jgi:hypothetical protein
MHNKNLEDNVYCQECRCKYVGWKVRCPVCKSRLVDEPVSEKVYPEEILQYDTLIDTIRGNGGRIEIRLSTTDIGKRNRWNFPYFGYGYAWEKRMEGEFNNLSVILSASEVFFKRKSGFPYAGYGFGWVKSFRGAIGGNEITLSSTKVAREKIHTFPFFGFGRAWTEELSGQCGESITASFTTTRVGKKRRTTFPWLGYGYGWVQQGVLMLSVSE